VERTTYWVTYGLTRQIKKKKEFINFLKKILTKWRNNKMEKDIFGFADAIDISKLNNEQIKTLEEIFKDYK
jgi:hypothetical protein